jgi:Domain of unknown function DUF11
MSFDGHRLRAGRALAIGAILLVGLAAPVVLGSPAYASSSTDLGISLANKADAVPGKRVSYQIVVHNAGPATAQRVQIDFYTSTQLSSVEYVISTAAAGGHCYRSPKETACIFGTIKAGATQHVTISGVMPAKLAKGTTITNKVTLASDTALLNKANDVATDNYRIGIARVAATPLAAASASVSPDSKLQKITSAASTAISLTHKALLASFLALGAAALWFSIGLTLRHRSRRKRAALDTD